MFDFAGLEDDISIRQDHGRAETAQPLQHLQGVRVEPLSERVVHEEGGHRQQLHLARMFDTEALEGADIVAIAQLGEQILQDSPIAGAGSDPIGLIEMVLQVLLDPVIVEQCVVDIDEEDDRMRQCHAALLPAMASCHHARTRTMFLSEVEVNVQNNVPAQPSPPALVHRCQPPASWTTMQIRRQFFGRIRWRPMQRLIRWSKPTTCTADTVHRGSTTALLRRDDRLLRSQAACLGAIMDLIAPVASPASSSLKSAMCTTC